MKSIICPNCGCIAHLPERHLPHIKKTNCEMCGMETYLYDGEVDPLSFPTGSDNNPEKPE